MLFLVWKKTSNHLKHEIVFLLDVVQFVRIETQIDTDLLSAVMLHLLLLFLLVLYGGGCCKGR